MIHLDVVDPAVPAESTVWTQFLDFLVKAGYAALTVAGIVVGAIILVWILRFVIRRVVNRIVNGAKSKANVDDTQALERSPLASVRLVQRTRTLGSILQNIVKDVLNGIFIVAEDQVGIGDVVDLGLASGIVEYVSVRVTHVRDVNGTLWYVRNGEITRIGNLSQGWSRVIVDLSIPVDADIEEVEQLMLSTAKGLAKDTKWRTRILEQPEVWGLESITGDALVIRLVLKTRANAKDDVARELRMRLKKALDEAGITLPALTTVMPSGIEGAQRVRGANPPKTKPTAVTPPPAASRPVWKPKRTPKTPPPASPGDDTKGTP